MSVEFLLTSLVIVLLPGTGVIYTLAYGLGRGFRLSVVAAFGCTLGIVPHIVASIAGLSALLHTSAMMFEIVRYLGVAYLFYMAWTMLRAGGAMQVDAKRDSEPYWQVIRNGIALNLLNPKLTMFFVAFLPQFVPAEAAGSTVALGSLALVFMAMTFVVFVAYGGLASLARDYVISRPNVMKWISRSFAGAFGLLGLRLALAER